jgi:hypothetical protein
LLIATDYPTGSVSNLVAVYIEFLIQNPLAIDDLGSFRGVFQGPYTYRFKGFVLELYRWEPLLLKIWLFDCFLVVFWQGEGFDLWFYRLKDVLKDCHYRQAIG